MKARITAHLVSVCLGALALGLGPVQSMAAPQANAGLIRSGRSIGRLHLGHDGAASLDRMPKPNFVDAGMSQSRQVWVSKSDRRVTLYLHTTSNGALDVKPTNGVTINEIRTNSPRFHTRSGLGVGTTLAKIKPFFSHLHRLPASETGGTVIYDAPKSGIAFEFLHDSPSARCIGITVYMVGDGHAVSRLDVKNIMDVK